MSIKVLPKGYTRVGEEKGGLYSWRTKLRVYGIVMFAYGILMVIGNWLFPLDMRLGISLWILLLTLLVILVLHEALHFLPLWIVGLRPRFVLARVPGYGCCPCPGVLPSGGFFSQREYLVCLLLPQVMTVAGVLWLIASLIIAPLTQVHLIVFWGLTLNLLGGVEDIRSAIYIGKNHKRSTLYLSESLLITGIYDRD